MPSFNKVMLMGNLTKDPELKKTQSGMAVANVGMAVNRRYKDKEEVVFVDVTFWGKTAEIMCQYLTKGSPIFVEGRLQLDQWETDDGQKRSRMKVICENFQFIGSKGDCGGEKPAAAAEDDGAPSFNDDNVPF